MSTKTSLDPGPVNLSEEKLSYRTRVPLMHCRHYVRNYIDLFQDILARIYTAGGVQDAVLVAPGETVGEALGVTEQQAAVALVDDTNGESAYLSLIRTICLDGGTEPGDADSVVEIIRLNFRATMYPTFEAKADAVEDGLDGLVPNFITQAQFEQVVRGIRSFGGAISDLLGFEFPELDDYRIDLTSNPERYILVSGPYSAEIPADPDEFLSCSFAGDEIELTIKLDSFRIAASTDFEFYKVKGNGNTKEKHEMVMSAIGALEFRDVRLTLELDDSLGAATPYTWAPGHDVRRAEWTKPSFEVSVSSVDLDLAGNAATQLLAFYEWHWTVQGLEEEWEDLIRDSINDMKEIAGVGAIARDYISPIAARLIPISHGLSKVRFREPFEPEDIVSYQTFAGLETTYETRAVVIRNEQPDPLEFEPVDTDPATPGGVPPVDPPDIEWQPAPVSGSGGPLDPNDLVAVAAEVARVEATPGLTARSRAIAALSIEGFPPQSIGALEREHVQWQSGTVRGRPVGKGTLTLLRAVEAENTEQGGGEHLLRYGGFTGRPGLVRADLRGTQRRVALAGMLGTVPGSTETMILAPDFDPDIWSKEYTDDTPLRTSRGTPGDPGWIGLSTNCVVATSLYRKLRLQGLFAAEGVAPDATLGDVHYALKDCQDVAADFSGDAPDDAPALAVAGLVIALGASAQDLTHYKVDVRLRLKPVIYGRGCLPDSAVTEVSNALDCIEGLTGGVVPLATRLRQIDYRDFVFLSADFSDLDSDIQVLGLRLNSGAAVPDATSVTARLRAVITHWFPTVPEPPILYNCFRPAGGETRNYFTQGGWLCVYRRYPVPDFSDVQLG